MSQAGYSVSSMEVCLESLIDQPIEFDNAAAELTRVDDLSSIDWSNHKEPQNIESLYEHQKAIAGAKLKDFLIAEAMQNKNGGLRTVDDFTAMLANSVIPEEEQGSEDESCVQMVPFSS